MVNNYHLGILCVLGPIALGACSIARSQDQEAFQGIVELEERTLAFEFGGRVEQVLVKRGDTLAAEQLLATLDGSLERTTQEARFAEASAGAARVRLLVAGSRKEDILAMAARVRALESVETRFEHDLKREQELAKSGITPQSIVDTLASELSRATAEREAAEQSLALLRKGTRVEEIDNAKSLAQALNAGVDIQRQKLERHQLKAPVAGQVLDVHVETGETVAVGTPVVTLGDVDHPYADIFLPQGDLGGLKVGTNAHLRVDALAREFSGTVEHIARQLEFTPRFLFSERERPNLVIRVRVRLSDPEHALFAGVPAFVRLER